MVTQLYICQNLSNCTLKNKWILYKFDLYKAVLNRVAAADHFLCTFEDESVTNHCQFCYGLLDVNKTLPC